MSTQEDSRARRTTAVTDSELTTRLLAFLQGRAGSAPEADHDLPATDPALVERLRAAHAEALPGRPGDPAVARLPEPLARIRRRRSPRSAPGRR